MRHLRQNPRNGLGSQSKNPTHYVLIENAGRTNRRTDGDWKNELYNSVLLYILILVVYRMVPCTTTTTS